MIYLDLGRREMGKTTLALSLVRRCPSRVLFDPRCQFALGGLTAATYDDVAAGFDRLADHAAPDHVDEFVVAPVHDPQTVLVGVMRETRHWVAHSRAPLAVLLDEVTFVDLMASPDFIYLLRASPRQQLHIILTAHRPKDIDVNIRAIADEWLMFRTVQRHDLDAIEERCGEEAVALLPTLAPYEYLQWDDARGKLHRHRPLTAFARINDAGPTGSASLTGPGDAVVPPSPRLPFDVK